MAAVAETQSGPRGLSVKATHLSSVHDRGFEVPPAEKVNQNGPEKGTKRDTPRRYGILKEENEIVDDQTQSGY